MIKEIMTRSGQHEREKEIERNSGARIKALAKALATLSGTE